MLVLTDLSRDLTVASNAAQAKMEEIKKTTFTSLDASLCDVCNCPASGFRNGCVFNVMGFSNSDAKGRIEITDLILRNPATETLKEVRVVISFKSRGRVIGEDQNLNGKWDAGEDKIGTGYAAGRLDSPVELISLIAK